MADRIIVSLDVQSGRALKHFVCMLASKQHLLQTALELADPFVDSAWADELVTKEIQTLQDFRSHWNEATTPGMRFDWDEETLDLTMAGLTSEQHEAWASLVERMWVKAQTMRWALTRRTTADNPKYALRTWLLRLGMQGDGYRETRTTLVASLPGNASFRHGRP